ncbi:CDGSH iron-sulfur domain-containing protein 3, mitochondrial [Anopheles maculipalpis]|uniref:CDGSH iron-sulfur domain-containing protein 3, mitochondrial n=1 Tax=Anopheles maculipalpis TaxID=1496333 RepID=UPI002159A0B2|nr:CDGSH iron-sulfur domain-containing protein 3, mitochondrial [Anopheles maculipalpis]
MNALPKVFLSRWPSYTVRSSPMCAVRCYSTAGNETKFPKNVIEHLNTAQEQQTNGVVYDKKPFRMELEEGKRYSWCLCGRSKGQPLCDGTHKLVQYKITQRPIRFQVEKSGTYWLCNCKQTKHRPFCDGTHKCEEVQKTAGK